MSAPERDAGQVEVSCTKTRTDRRPMIEAHCRDVQLTTRRVMQQSPPSVAPGGREEWRSRCRSTRPFDEVLAGRGEVGPSTSQVDGSLSRSRNDKAEEGV
jgi:hypothetical protein